MKKFYNSNIKSGISIFPPHIQHIIFVPLMCFWIGLKEDIIVQNNFHKFSLSTDKNE